MLTESGEYNLVAYLMSDQNDNAMQVVKFEGTTKASMSKRTDYGHCCLLMSVRAIQDYIESLNETKVDLSTGKRVETNLFDKEAFREAWINACVHNSWKDMFPPSVFIFDDHIEIQSYGGIPYSLSVDDFYAGRSMPVNEALFKIFSLMDYSEQSGHGVSTIVSSYGKGAIELSNFMVTVTIPFSFPPVWVSSRNSEATFIGLTDRGRIIIDYVSVHPNASLAEVAEGTGFSKASCGREISSLKSKGLLVNDGNTRRNEWRVIR